MAPSTLSRIFREFIGQDSYQSEYYVVRQPSHRRRSRARSVERTSGESRPRKERHVHETVEIHRKPSKRHGDREKKVRKEYEYRYELFQDDSEAEGNDDLKHVSWAQWPDLQSTLNGYQYQQPEYQQSPSEPQTDNPALQEWISAELALIWSSLDHLQQQHNERSANYDPYLQQAILASYATFKQEQIQPLLDEIARLERQGKDYEKLVKELMGVIRGYQTELRTVWDREEKERKDKEERAVMRQEQEAGQHRREWETWNDLSGPTLAGGLGSNPASPTGSAPPPYNDVQLPPEQPAPQAVPGVPARPPKKLEPAHQPRVRFEEILHEIPAPRHYADDEYEYGPRDYRRKERGRGRGRDHHHRDDRHHDNHQREYEYRYDWPQSPRSSSKETQLHRNHDRQPDHTRHEHRDREQEQRHHRRHRHDHDGHGDRRERRPDDQLTDWNIPSPNILAPSTHWDAHLPSPRSPRDFDAYEPRTRTEHRPRRRHSVSYSSPSQASYVSPHWLPAGDVDRESDKHPRGFRVVRFAV
ncbi:hypothetical protein SMACR_07706 [Sordaria macrospora]|uniref:WGS project CABT00000000 data, contig 2.27 n=2 Tax=Sordaria macrospora TaxID=5147 RepID=F7W4E4_SORMK|nr:uncharacterized protein SMAC_07706 [Sordaria macrospora k-hell]KAA8634893.1 hypothetical protein SMACR_07706 [Sordaria macrospora]WPJ67396.1 hypothetical protein SMAC4_07706 [Sordaria macrospora]CCC14897.1 unnamed protein product [Sordaria macrospora k-hell]